MRRLELEARVGGISQPAFPVLLEATAQHAPDRSGCVGGKHRPVRLATQDRSHRLVDLVTAEGAAAGQHLVYEAAEGPEIRALVDGLPAGLLGRHIGRGPEDHPHISDGRRGDRGKDPGRADRSWLGVADGLRQAKIQHLHRAIGSDLDVRRLQIAVDDAVIVGGFERVGDLARDGEHLV